MTKEQEQKMRASKMPTYTWIIAAAAALGFYLGGMQGAAYCLGGLSLFFLVFAIVAGRKAEKHAS